MDTAWSPIHLADHLAQHGKTSAEDVENWDTGSPSAKAVIKEHRTRDIHTREKGENPRKLVKLELMTTTVIRWVLQLSCKHHLTVIPTLYTFLMFELMPQLKHLQQWRCLLRLEHINMEPWSARLTLVQVVMSCHCTHLPSYSPDISMLKPSTTHLTAYNRSKINQSGTLYTAID